MTSQSLARYQATTQTTDVHRPVHHESDCDGVAGRQHDDQPVRDSGQVPPAPGSDNAPAPVVEPGLGVATISQASTRPVSDRFPPTAEQAAAVNLKAQLDLMREALGAERARSRQLMEVSRSLLDIVGTQLDDADRLNEVTSAYADALGQFVVPDSPPDV